MPYAKCQSCDKLLSISINPRSNPDKKASLGEWAPWWRMCSGCSGYYCDTCAPDENQGCPSCSGVFLPQGRVSREEFTQWFPGLPIVPAFSGILAEPPANAKEGRRQQVPNRFAVKGAPGPAALAQSVATSPEVNLDLAVEPLKPPVVENVIPDLTKVASEPQAPVELKSGAYEELGLTLCWPSHFGSARQQQNEFIRKQATGGKAWMAVYKRNLEAPSCTHEQALEQAMESFKADYPYMRAAEVPRLQPNNRYLAEFVGPVEEGGSDQRSFLCSLKMPIYQKAGHRTPVGFGLIHIVSVVPLADKRAAVECLKAMSKTTLQESMIAEPDEELVPSTSNSVAPTKVGVHADAKSGASDYEKLKGYKIARILAFASLVPTLFYMLAWADPLIDTLFYAGGAAAVFVMAGAMFFMRHSLPKPLIVGGLVALTMLAPWGLGGAIAMLLIIVLTVLINRLQE